MPAPRTPDTLSVTQFNQRITGLLEGQVGLAWIEGEISNLVVAASGHVYLTLKDETSQLRAAMFRNRSRLLGMRPRNGMRVRVRARPTLYLARGEFQVIVEHMEDAGLGDLQRAFEALKQKLAAEGLFALERKRALPAYPRAVGVVTSATGAVIHDVITVLGRRAPNVPVILYPAVVQGAEAPAAVVAAIATANRRDEVDVLIVGRGGGSLEDLQAFNDERVARAIAGSAIPVVSAVGHETDVTIADFVADLRAPTPSAAAERVAPPVDALAARVQQALRLLARQAQSRIGSLRAELAVAQSGLVRPDRRLREYRQRFDELDLRARRALKSRLSDEHVAIAELARRLRQASPDRQLAAKSSHVLAIGSRLQRALQAKTERRRLALEAQAARLNTVSPLATLARGYAIARDADGRVVRSVDAVAIDDALAVRVADGELACRVEGRKAGAPD